MKRYSMLATAVLAGGIYGCSATPPAATTHTSTSLSSASDVGQNQLVVEIARFERDSPAGIAVSSQGRVFVTFPWLDGQPASAVGELTEAGEAIPYPNATWNQWDAQPGPSALRAIVCAQAVTITREDDGEFLWVLDSGNPRQAGVIIAGPKLFKIDLADDTIAQVFYFDHERDFASNSVLSDLRVDSDRHTAYISDAQRGGLYVIDLKQRQTRARLIGHEATRPEPGVSLQAALSDDNENQSVATSKLGVAGIELSADGEQLFFHALAGRTLYGVPTALLRDPVVGDAEVADAVENLGTTGSAMDGLMRHPATDELYMAALEHNAIFLRQKNGEIQTLVADERLSWPDSIALGSNGYLYLTASARHLKRPYAATPTNDQPGYVLKVSLDYLEQAAFAAKEAEKAQQALQESQQRAAEAEMRVDHARKVAEAEAAVAAGLLREVSRASEAVTNRQFELAHAEQVVVDQLQKQQETAAQAKLDADQADAQAVASNLAAEEAEAAARIAELKAEQAQQAVALALELSQVADQSQAQATAAETAYYQAIVHAERAAQLALDARANANRMQDAAEAYQARAEVAADVWQAEAGYAQEFFAAVEKAEHLAQVAKQSWQDAQLAEVRKAEQELADDDSRFELADVPTNVE